MSAHGNVEVNKDGSGNLSGGVEGANGPHSVSATAFANGILGLSARAVGATVDYKNDGGHGASLTGQHIRSFGDQVTASGTAALLNTNDHKLAVNAFTTHTMPAQGPSFSTHGGGVDYKFQDSMSVGAAMANTPKYNHTEYTLNSSVNLHRTPNSSLDLNATSTRATGPFASGKWNNAATFTYKRQF